MVEEVRVEAIIGERLDPYGAIVRWHALVVVVQGLLLVELLEGVFVPPLVP
jgi:hypothetical protein